VRHLRGDAAVTGSERDIWVGFGWEGRNAGIDHGAGDVVCGYVRGAEGVQEGCGSAGAAGEIYDNQCQQYWKEMDTGELKGDDGPRQRFPSIFPSALIMLGFSGSTAGRVLMVLYFVPMALYWVVWVL
jgi:hypothetical protein